MSYYGTIYADPEITHRAMAVYMYLKDRSAAQGKCWPGIRTIAAGLKLSRSTVKRALNELAAKGYLVKQARHRSNGSSTSNLYTSSLSAKGRLRPRGPRKTVRLCGERRSKGANAVFAAGGNGVERTLLRRGPKGGPS